MARYRVLGLGFFCLQFLSLGLVPRVKDLAGVVVRFGKSYVCLGLLENGSLA